MQNVQEPRTLTAHSVPLTAMNKFVTSPDDIQIIPKQAFSHDEPR